MKKVKNKTIKVGYQGTTGAYSEMAAEKFLESGLQISTPPSLPLPRGGIGHSETALIGFKTFDEIFQSIHDKKLDYGVVPVENSLAGSIHKNFDLLAEHDLEIISETYVHVQHQLLGLPSAKLSDITEVYSHWQALAQVAHTIKSILPDAKVIEYYDTAGSAEMVKKENLKNRAAIASVKAGEVYGLKVLAKNVQDDKENYTRFVVVAGKKTGHRTQDTTPSPSLKRRGTQTQVGQEIRYKTSIVFAGAATEVGFLFRSLACFSLRGINLTKIESRPMPKKAWQYYFYIDCEGGIDASDGIGDESSKKVRLAIENLREIATFVKVLGSYPAAKI
jgi:prephenate dehydratase